MTSSSLRSSTISSGLRHFDLLERFCLALHETVHGLPLHQAKRSFVGALHLLQPRQRLQLSVSCMQAPQHLHEDVVLPLSLPILRHLHLGFSGLNFM